MDIEDDLSRKVLKAGHWLLIVVLAALAVWAVWKVRTVAIPVLLAVFISSVTIPPADRLVRRGVHPALATTLVWLGLLAAGALLVLLLIPITLAGVDDLGLSVDQFTDRVQDAAAGLGFDHVRITDLTDRAREWVLGRSERIANGALTGVRTTGEFLVGAVLAIVLAVYFTYGGRNLLGWVAGLLPERNREPLRSGASVVFQVVGRYVRGVALVGFVDGFFIGLSLWVLGVPLALPLAVLTWAGAFLPIVGAFLAGLLAAVVAFVAKGWIVALIVVAVTIAVQQIEGHVLAPQIYGRALELPSPVVLVLIALGGSLAGVAGAFLAAPLASAAVALLHHRAARAEGDSPPGGEPDPG